MMGTSESLIELVAAAQATAKMSEDRISEIIHLKDGSDAQVEDLRAATVALELAAVDIFSVFEARMQHHFRRGPFSRKLKALLLVKGQTDLANRVHQYYLAINVLKHGKGASYRELLKAPSAFVVLRSADDVLAGQADAPAGLVDVSVAGFFDGLTKTILDAHHFLENK